LIPKRKDLSHIDLKNPSPLKRRKKKEKKGKRKKKERSKEFLGGK